MRKIFLIISIIVVMVIVIFITLKFPIKKVVKVDFHNINQQDLSEKDSRIICRFSTETGPQWKVIGKDNGLFQIVEPCQYVIIKGKIPKHLNGDIYFNSARNMFIFDGKVAGEEIGDDGGIYKVFEVEKWNLTSPVDRGYGFVELMPSDALTLYDYIPLK